MRGLIGGLSRRGVRREAGAAGGAERALEPAPFGPAGPWVAHFRMNLAAPRAIRSDDGHALSAAERRAIRRSIAKFQLGESSDGRFLQHHAALHAARSGDRAFAEAVRLFIEEEQRHAAELAGFMERQGLPLMRRHWSDSIFRRVRKLGGLDLALSVLLTAELVALVYYQALARATGSLGLRSICAEILRDERTHVVFQAGTLGRVRLARSPAVVRFSIRVQRLFLLLALLFVWLDHWRVFRAGQFGWRRYWHACWGAFASVESLLSPRRMEWRSGSAAVLAAAEAEAGEAAVECQRAGDRQRRGHGEDR